MCEVARSLTIPERLVPLVEDGVTSRLVLILLEALERSRTQERHCDE